MKTAAISPPESASAHQQPEPATRSGKDIQIRNILVPIDFSEPSALAIDYAQLLGSRFGAKLHLIHVYEPTQPFVDSSAVPLILPEVNVAPEVRRQLQAMGQKHGLIVPDENIHAAQGSPYEEICRAAGEIGSDLIVIPTRGNAGFKHFVLGSTAERVVRNSPCPVLAIHPGQISDRDNRSRTEALAFRKIVVPIDFSNCSIEGLNHAKRLALEFQSQLLLIHAIHLQYYISGDEYSRYDFPVVMHQMEAFARDQMRELVQNTDWDGLTVNTAIETGHAGQLVCDMSADHGADLIVTSTHGYTGLKHVFLGSTAEYVVRHATCPVLVVPSHPRPAMPNGRSI